MSAHNPRVSVIIPAYNAEHFICETVDSVLGQTYANLELIVVDDGSTDRTRELLLSYGNRLRYLYQENSGSCSKPRNEGVKIASGELIAFIDADDIMAPDRITKEVALFSRHRDLGLVFTNYRDFEAGKTAEQGHFEACPQLSALLGRMPGDELGMVLESEHSTELLLTENFGSSSPMVRRAVLDAVGGYDQVYTPSDDVEFTYRVSSAYKIGLIPSVGWDKREHPTNMSANIPRVLKAKILTRRRMLQLEREPRRRRKLERRLAIMHFDLAYYYTGEHNALAFRHALRSLAFRPWPFPRSLFRLFVRLLLDVLGRSTVRKGAVTHRT
jgi:glycosyltransferase involved in cell wall biosynthesis